MGKVPTGYKVSYGGVNLPVTSTGQFLLGLSRDAPDTIEIMISSPSIEVSAKSFKVRSRKYDIQRVDGVPQDRVTPPASVTARIIEESGRVRKARTSLSQQEDFLSGFIEPLKGPLTGVYGSQRIYNGIPKSPHYGIDYGVPKGTRVKAPATGVVTLVHDDMYYSGGTLILDHGHGLSSTFLHLSKILVVPGMEVKRGEELAEVGDTGRATGPHLDWRMNWRDVRVDPLLVLKAIPAKTE